MSLSSLFNLSLRSLFSLSVAAILCCNCWMAEFCAMLSWVRCWIWTVGAKWVKKDFLHRSLSFLTKKTNRKARCPPVYAMRAVDSIATPVWRNLGSLATKAVIGFWLRNVSKDVSRDGFLGCIDNGRKIGLHCIHHPHCNAVTNCFAGLPHVEGCCYFFSLLFI